MAYCVKFISSGNLLWLRLAGETVLRREAIGSNLPCKGKERELVVRRSRRGRKVGITWKSKSSTKHCLKMP